MAKKKGPRTHAAKPVAKSSVAAATKQAAHAAPSLEDLHEGVAIQPQASHASAPASKGDAVDVEASEAGSYADKAAVPPTASSTVVDDPEAVSEDLPSHTKVASGGRNKALLTDDDGVPERWDATDSEADFATASGSPPPSIKGAPRSSFSSPRKPAPIETKLSATTADAPKPLNDRRIAPHRQRSPAIAAAAGQATKPYATLQAERPKRPSSAADKRRPGDDEALGGFDFDARQRAEAGTAKKRARREGQRSAAESDGDTDGVVVETIQLARSSARQVTTQDLADDDLTLVHDVNAASTVETQARRENRQTMVERHVKFFDRKGTGVISPKDTWDGFRELGFNVFLSLVAAFIIHSGFSWPSKGFGVPDPRFRCYVSGMPRCKHGSDSGSYDTDGEFVKPKFEALWERHSPDGESMDKWELYRMTVQHRLLFDPFGWAAQIFEWLSTYLLLADANGRIHKADVEGVFTGDIFYRIAGERARDRKGGPVSAVKRS